MRVELPDDLREFLASGRQLAYDAATCEAGRVTLRALADLRIERFPVDLQSSDLAAEDPHRGELGCWLVPGVDLVATAGGDHDPRGLLLWLPVERRFGIWDPDHGSLRLFRDGTTWSEIAAEPASFIDAQWDEGVPTEQLRAWAHEYSPEQLHEPLPFAGDVR